MNYFMLFCSGLLFANGIPHFTNGISGRDFHNPFIHKYFKSVPSPLFNVVWGLLNFLISGILLTCCKSFSIGLNLEFSVYILGFVFASVGLSIYFKSREKD